MTIQDIGENLDAMCKAFAQIEHVLGWEEDQATMGAIAYGVADRISELEAENKELREAISSPWISVDDRLPEDAKDRYLLHRELGEGTNDVVGYRMPHHDKWVKYSDGFSELEHVTHWMPIPSVNT